MRLSGRPAGPRSQASSGALNQFVYAFALPAMLFIAVYRGSLDEILSGAFLLGVILATLVTALAGFALSHFLAGAALATVATNIVSFALAIVFVAFDVKIGLPAERFATLLAAAAGPCALFAIGLFVSQLSIRAGAAASWQTSVLKLVLHPS